ncbi:MAG: transposase, partial [Gemmatimonadetes bacterium]|nr:transposase [Gemmatimonadota bacterium]
MVYVDAPMWASADSEPSWWQWARYCRMSGLLMCYPACKVSLKSACKMSHIGAAAVEWLRRRWVGLRGIIANGSFAVASPPNGRDAMIGRETRVLLRHYLEQGLSKAAVARLAGVSRRTVHRWIAAGQLDRDLDEKRVGYGPRRPRPSGLDPYKEIIKVRLAAYPALSAVRLFEEIREAGYEGGYDQV